MIRLGTLVDGKPHPSAQTPVLFLTCEPGSSDDHWNISISGSRLAFFSVWFGYKTQLVVWDWQAGEILLVCSISLFSFPLIQIVRQELKDYNIQFAGLVDDFWLLILSDGSGPQPTSKLTFLSTKETREDGGGFVRTSLFLDGDLEMENLLGGHEPSCTDDLSAPFHPDPSQRVLVVKFADCEDVLVMKAEAILKLVQERKDEDLQWEEWEDYATWISSTGPPDGLWIADHRLRCMILTDPGVPLMDVYDFGTQASGRYTKMVKDGFVQSFAPSATKNLPLEFSHSFDAYASYDSIVFATVKLTTPQLNQETD